MNVEMLNRLAVRASSGDQLAASDLQEFIESPMAHIVRRALRTGTPGSPLVRRIRAQVGSLVGTDEELDSASEARVARQLSESLIDGLCHRPPARDFARETVVA
jgi:hypothetical protein